MKINFVEKPDKGLKAAWRIMEIALIVLVMAAAMDKFTELLMNYVDPHLKEILPSLPNSFTLIVSIIEIVVISRFIQRKVKRKKRFNNTLSLSE